MADYNTFSLKEMCHVCTNENGDSFVGVKIDEKKAIVSFPLGYCLPEDDATLRKEIRALLRILYLFGEKEATPLRGLRIIENHSLGFPVQAYLDIIDYYIENNGHYYVETEKRYKTDTKGKINWPKTIKKQRSFIIEGSPIYSHFEIEYKNPSKNQLITIINKFCVFHAFQRLGWLYTNQQIDNPGIAANDGTLRMFLQELHKKNGTINKDRDKRLFKSMITMIKFLDNRLLNAGFTFGTDNFEYIWQKLIDIVFGESDKEAYLPKATWIERNNPSNIKEKRPLIPDTIMMHNDKIYVIDAKYYRYGLTLNLDHLPGSSDIDKQITYGENIASLKDEFNNNKNRFDVTSIFNAFVMPYNSAKGAFGLHDRFINVAEAIGTWRKNDKNYEKIQGILMDTKYLMQNYTGNHETDKALLSLAIEQYFKTNQQQH